MGELAVQISYQLQFTSAFHIGSGYGLAGVADATVVRNQAQDLYVPGASIKGRARWQLTNLLMLERQRFPGLQHNHEIAGPCPSGADHTPCPLCNLFGSPLIEGSLTFTDAQLMVGSNLADEAARHSAKQQELRPQELTRLRNISQVEQRSQVMLSRVRRVAREELLFVTEVGQAGLCFEGKILGRLPACERELTVEKVGQIPEDLGWLLAALLGVEQMGGRKSRGLGYCRFVIDGCVIDALDAAERQTVNPSIMLGALHSALRQSQEGQA